MNFKQQQVQIFTLVVVCSFALISMGALVVESSPFSVSNNNTVVGNYPIHRQINTFDCGGGTCPDPTISTGNTTL